MHVAFDTDSLSSDGGTALLSQPDRGIGLRRTQAEAFEDRRDLDEIWLTYDELIRQHTHSVALGCDDGIDPNFIARDPMLNPPVRRDPDAGPGSASRSTLSRFENAPSTRALISMGRRIEAIFILRPARRHRKLTVVTLDADSAEAATPPACSVGAAAPTRRSRQPCSPGTSDLRIVASRAASSPSGPMKLGRAAAVEHGHFPRHTPRAHV